MWNCWFATSKEYSDLTLNNSPVPYISSDPRGGMLGGLPDGVLLTIGLVLLVLGGELVVQGSIRIAGLLGMPSFLVGFTLVAIGTSLPELGVILNAINRGSPEAVDLAVGGVIGSNIANVMLVLAIAMLIGAASQPDKDLKQDALMLLAATAFVVLSVIIGKFPVWLGVLSIIWMGGYYAYIFRTRGGDDEGEEDSWIPQGYAYAIIAFLVGLVLVKYGSDLLIEGGVGLAISIGVSEAVIGLTLVAFGTSLPELAVTITASIRGVQGVAIGNILGSNVANVMAVLGIGAIVAQGLSVSESFLTLDIWVLLGSSGIICVSIFLGKGVSKPLGAFLLFGYFFYVSQLFIG